MDNLDQGAAPFQGRCLFWLDYMDRLNRTRRSTDLVRWERAVAARRLRVLRHEVGPDRFRKLCREWLRHRGASSAEGDADR